MGEEKVRLRLLGQPVVERGGRPVTFDTRKAIALLALVAASPGGCSRDSLMAMLWPDSPEERARSSLRRTLSVTAAPLGTALAVARSRVDLDREAAWCDMWALQALTAGSSRADLERGAGLWRGEFLDGFTLRGCPEFEAWQRQSSEHLRQQYAGVLAALVAAELAVGDLPAALSNAQRWLALDPLDEPAHRAVMQVHARAGSRAAALRQYGECVRILDEELGVLPLPDTTTLYEDILAGRLEPVAPPPPIPSRPQQREGPEELVGRDAILSLLLSGAAAAGGTGTLLAVHGATGVGKSRVVGALVAQMRDEGRTVLAARAYESERDLAYGVAADIVGLAFRHQPQLDTELTGTILTEIARLVPGLHRSLRLPEPPPLSSAGDRLRVYLAFAELVAVLGRDLPALIVVDDAHWIDDASSQLLAYVLRRLDSLPALIVLAWQQEAGLGPSLREAIEEAVAGGRGRVVNVPPLSVDDVRRWLAAAGDETADADALWAMTGGLPLLVASYLQEPHGQQPAASGVVPLGVRRALEARLDRVPETTAQMLTAAAVLGGHFDPDLVRATSGRTESEVADAIEDAVRRGLLIESHQAGSPRSDDHYAFAFGLLRDVAYERCGAARRRLLHGRAADAIAQRFGGKASSAYAAAVADHLQRAGRATAAASWSWSAVRASAELFAHEEALTHAGAALALGHPPAEAQTAMAEALIALGRYEEAQGRLEAVAATVPSADPARAGIEQRLAAIHDRLGDWDVADRHLQAALACLHDDPAARARVEADRALVAHRRGASEASRLAAVAVSDAEAAGDDRALAKALDVAGMVAAARGDLRDAEQLLRASVRAARDCGDLGSVVAALNNLSRTLNAAGRLPEALAVAEEALSSGVQSGDVHRVAALHSNLGDLLHAAGRAQEAVDQLKAAARLFGAIQAESPADLRPEIWTLVEW